MAQYELMVILNPTLEDEEVPEAMDHLKGLIAEHGGTDETAEVQGRRRLGYPIHKHRDGTIVVARFDMPSQRVQEIEAGLRLDERYLRNMLIRM